MTILYVVFALALLYEAGGLSGVGINKPTLISNYPWLDKDWVVRTVYDQSVYDEINSITMKVNSCESEATGFNGCGEYKIIVMVDAVQFKVQDIITIEDCLEQSDPRTVPFYDALRAADSYEIDCGILYLKAGEKRIIALERDTGLL